MKNKLIALAVCYGVYAMASSVFMFINIVDVLSLPGMDTPVSGIPFLTGAVIYCSISALTVVWIILIPVIICYLLLVKRRRKLVYNLALLGCFGVPVGTVIGLYLMKILDRPEIKEQFLS
jgi:hypothetical protein